MYSESTLLVRPEHLNHHGFLYGGHLLKWLDEQAYIAAITHMHPSSELVTVAIDRVEFHHSVRQGSLLKFRSQIVHTGRTSVTVFTAVLRMPQPLTIFEAYVTFVAIDPNGQPCPVGQLLLSPYAPKTGEENRHWEVVEQARAQRKGGKKP